MRSVRLSDHVVVHISSVWQTTCTVLRAPAGTVLVDCVVLPDEMRLLPAELEAGGFDADALALVATHADWDHLFGRMVFPDAPLHCSEPVLQRIHSGRDERDRESSLFFEGFYIQDARPVRLDDVEVMRDGENQIAGLHAEVAVVPGHTNDSTAILFDEHRVLNIGDYLSPVEIPRVRESIDDYVSALNRLEPLLQRIDTIIPGHGWPLTADEGKTILEDDRSYLQRLLQDGADTPLPADRDSAQQRSVHLEVNVPRLSGEPMLDSDVASMFRAETGD
jgi:glyoxylase-like metal-dependent hydrolase (beta-lactamase superfamily II)